MEHLEINGRRIEYFLHGPSPEKGTTLVFLHEGLGSAKMWKDFPAQVSEATGLGVFCYSRFGYGDSDPVELPRPLRFMHEEAVLLPKVMDAMNIHRAILVGHSDGGSIALIHVGSANDERVAALVLEAPHVFTEQLTVQSIAAAAVEYEQSDLKERLSRYHTNVDNAFWGWNRVWLSPEFLQWNIEEFLPAIHVPVLLIQGEQDNYGTLQQVKAIEKGLGLEPETLILSACGHSPHRDQPERTLKAIVNFVRGI